MQIRNEIKSVIVREGKTMDEVVNRLAEDYGWSRSVPNFYGASLECSPGAMMGAGAVFVWSGGY